MNSFRNKHTGVRHLCAGVSLLATVSLLGGLITPCPGSERPAAAASSNAVESASARVLDSAWKLACAITDLETSRAQHQQRVAEACIAAGDPARSMEMATAISGWRAYMVKMTAAVSAARQGDRTRVEAILGGVRSNALDKVEWSDERVRLKAAEARAYLAQADQLDDLRAQYIQSKVSDATLLPSGALAMLYAGDADGAMQVLNNSVFSGTFDDLSCHAEAFLLLADTGRLDPPRLAAVLDGATNSVNKVGGNRSLELWIQTAEVATRQTSPAASNILETATAYVTGCRFPPHIKGPLVAQLMRLWAARGNPGRFNELEGIASAIVVSDMISITKRPALYGLLGEAYHANSQPDKALDAFRKGFAETARQVNPRPRAISGIDLCLSMARSGFDTTLVQQELTELLGTF